MNIYEKLQAARVELQTSEVKASGHNDYAKYSYIELKDFVPVLNKIMADLKITSTLCYDAEMATLTLINSEKPDETVAFTCPMSEAQLKGVHAVQNLGAVMSYLRRYLWMTAMEIIDADVLDRTHGKTEPAVKKPVKKTEATQAAETGSETATCEGCGTELTKARKTYAEVKLEKMLCVRCEQEGK